MKLLQFRKNSIWTESALDRNAYRSDERTKIFISVLLIVPLPFEWLWSCKGRWRDFFLSRLKQVLFSLQSKISKIFSWLHFLFTLFLANWLKRQFLTLSWLLPWDEQFFIPFFVFARLLCYTNCYFLNKCAINFLWLKRDE